MKSEQIKTDEEMPLISGVPDHNNVNGQPSSDSESDRWCADFPSPTGLLLLAVLAFLGIASYDTYPCVFIIFFILPLAGKVCMVLRKKASGDLQCACGIVSAILVFIVCPYFFLAIILILWAWKVQVAIMYTSEDVDSAKEVMGAIQGDLLNPSNLQQQQS